MDISSKTSVEKRLASKEIFSKGLSLFQEGKSLEAEIFFSNALALDPCNIDALNLAGICAYQKQDFENALHFLNQANVIEPKSPYTCNTIGLIYQAQNKFTEALGQFDIAITLQNNIPELYNNRGNALKSLLQLEKAIEAYQKALKLDPNYIETLSNLGITLKELGKPDDALAYFENAIKINPNCSEAFNNAGTIFQEAGNHELALQCYGQALKINPNYIEALLNCGNTFRANKNLDGALGSYRKAISINPNHALAYYLIGEAFYEKGNALAAQANYQLAINIQPDYLDAKFALAVATIPKVFSSSETIEKSREAFKNQIHQLELSLSTAQASEDFTNAVAHQPFYLAYQELNNKNLLSCFGKLGCNILKKWQQKKGISAKCLSTKGPIRIGVVSAHFSNHPVWHAITKGILLHLDPELFEVHLFNLERGGDCETTIAKQHSVSHTQDGLNLLQWSRTITSKDIEVLFFPEVGMNPLTRQLASLRLAPIQASSWGHPETTGLPTMDYFVSAQDLEPNEAAIHYSERLIALPNLGCHFQTSEVLPSTLALVDINLSQQHPILLCPGSPSKYSPENDWVLTEIAKRLGKCQLVFFDFQSDLTHILKKRLEASFQKKYLRLEDYAKFIPFQSKENFYELMRRSNLYLDPIGFSGFNTAMQAVECNLPIVTRQGNFMRGRLTSGILKRMGIESLVAQSNEEYIELVVELISNKEKFKQIKSQFQRSKQILFNDLEPIKAFEEFLLIQCRPQ